MKSFKKMLKSEIDKVVPPLDEEIKNMPVPERSDVNANGSNTLTRSKKAVIVSDVAVVLVLLTVGLALGLTLPFNSLNEAFIFTVEINPSATFVTDKNGAVTDIVSSNADADIILANGEVKSQIIGKPLDEAIVAYTDCASKLGYIDVTEQGSAVRISACERGGELLDKAKSSLQSYFIDKGIFAVAISETVDLSTFSERCGFNATSFDSLKNAVKSCDVLFADRAAISADKNALTDLYNELVLSAEMVPVVKDYILENMELIKRFEILHPLIPTEQIESVIRDFSAELLAQYSNIFAYVLELIGQDGVIVNILKAPATAQEFADKLAYALDVKFTQRKDEFENIYNSLQSITPQQYENFVDGILDSYGSLTDYWNSIK